jgi:hypothetical protein
VLGLLDQIPEQLAATLSFLALQQLAAGAALNRMAQQDQVGQAAAAVGVIHLERLADQEHQGRGLLAAQVAQLLPAQAEAVGVRLLLAQPGSPAQLVRVEQEHRHQ